MVNSWSYLVVVLCLSVTSSRVLHHHGYKDGNHGNDISDVRMKKFSTPPTSNGLIIDQGGYPGNSTMTYVRGSSGTPENYHNTPGPSNDNNDDTTEENPKNICHELCRIGEGGNACMCDWAPIIQPPKAINTKLLWNKSSLPKWMYKRQVGLSDVTNNPSNNNPTKTPICDILCINGEGGNACMCDWTP